MIYNPDFDVDAVMKVLGTISDKYSEGSPEDEALRIAAVSLLYVRDIQKLEEYRKYFQEFVTGKPIIVSQSFATREDADKWLASGNAKEFDLVEIAGQGFVVYGLPKVLKFAPAPLPHELQPPETKADPK
ncbi:hypothetical protein [Vitiosangium sp. GDMCC 1.1324]|uniref:hypothetical protein n=1 Tax=Vitiosangium sp. (strain GDMCC 1.1324) TaxID=2138576 RepID=UPI000D3A4C67|nr:hypothetical protein [Vitiosangium sp. GDMCC 1.1324]PTL80576.1 hypothetical protein DAT35_28530 [Vitiosangium sp. GDMCC 1.1324]